MTALLGVKSGGHPKESGMKSEIVDILPKKKSIEGTAGRLVSLLAKTYKM